MEKDLIIDLTKMLRPKVCHNGVRRAVSEIKFEDEETIKLFTDSNGRVYRAVFLDPNTGEPCFPK